MSDPQGAELRAGSGTGTIADNDRQVVTVEPVALNVTEGDGATYTVVLGSAPTEVVTVAVKSPEGTKELAPNPEELVFTPGDWHIAQEVTVSAAQDEDAIADAPVSLAHEVRGGGYDEVGEPVVQVTIVEDDVATLAVADQRASEGAGMMRFEVSLSLASDDLVTVEYATGAGEDTALAEADYTAVRGTLQFPAQTTAAQINLRRR